MACSREDDTGQLKESEEREKIAAAAAVALFLSSPLLLSLAAAPLLFRSQAVSLSVTSTGLTR